jgi:hypothetical protein
MGKHISLVPDELLRGLFVSSAVVGLGVSCAGCGAQEDTKVTTAPQKAPPAIEGMRENLKQQAALKKAASKQQRFAPSGR